MMELVHTRGAFSVDRSDLTTTVNSDLVILIGAGALLAVITCAFALLPAHSVDLPLEPGLSMFVP